jgi:hypothetical protein
MKMCDRCSKLTNDKMHYVGLGMGFTISICDECWSKDN